MKNAKLKKIVSLLILTLLVMPLAYALGVTEPLPAELQLERGESDRFQFQIQATTSDTDLICNYPIEAKTKLEIELDTEEVTVLAGERVNIYGTVKVPDDVPLGEYVEEFCVQCASAEPQSGASINIKTCGLKINVKVVEERTRENMNIPKEPISGALLIVLLIIVLIILGGVYKLSKHNEKTQRKTTTRSKKKRATKSKTKHKTKSKKKRKK